MVFTHPVPLPLVPVPATASAGEGRMPVTAASRIIGSSPAAAQLVAAVAERTGIRLATADDASNPGDIILRIDPAVADAEGYTLRVDDDIEIVGADEPGLFYGTQTLLQLLREDDEGWGVLRARIEDAPRFAYRGAMLDVARHFFGVDDVKRYIDQASALKLNHLHLHLTDDQGWRVQIDSWPLLTELSSSSSANGDPGGFYTKDDYREIVAHAASRHMVLVPEVDLPGHTHSIGVAYPELVEDPVMNDELVRSSARLGQPLPVAGETYTGWGVGHSSVRIREERTYDFVRDVVRELAEMTPGPYLHIGGDESLGTAQEDFDHFVERATQIVVDAGKIPVAWHEVGAAENIAEGTIGQYWGNTSPQGTHAEEAEHFHARQGALIMSASNVTYLDMKYSPDYPLGLSWAAIIDVRSAYEWEPTEVVDVPPSAILGVETPMWTETTRTFDEVAGMVFPRIAGQAEIAWSPMAAPERTWESYRVRLGALAPLWSSAGIAFNAVDEIDWQER